MSKDSSTSSSGMWERRLLAAMAPEDGGDQASAEYGGYEGAGSIGHNQGYRRGLLDILHSRLLAGDASYHLDYTVLSVFLWTLALVLFVESGRHYIDKRAHNRAFFRTVLEGMYRELTTLGIVEFGLYLFQTYYQDFNDSIYKLFSKVHFLLFFTAIINALMSVILAFLSSRISNRMWVQTEELELNHYIAIREEFERIDAVLKQSTSRELDRTNRSLAESANAFTRSGLHSAYHNLKQRLRYPLMKRKHDRLLMQVRFHELRVHFLQANDLPLKFRVSEYLKKSELHVFKTMVHITTFAWITVASIINLLYFLMGITAYVTSDENVVQNSMAIIYAGMMIFYVPLAGIFLWKMKWIYRQIMQMKLIDLTAPDDDDDGGDSASYKSYDQEKEDFLPNNKRIFREDAAQVDRSPSRRSLVQGKKINQLNLFWGGDPHYIIGAFQFMQLGYAIAASVLLIFWKDVISFIVFPGFAIILLFVCYFFFVFTMAQVVPRYTLCTNLGQLVNRRRLHETMAKFKLDDAKRKRRHKHAEETIALRLRESLQMRLEPPQQQGKFEESGDFASVEGRVKAKAEVAQKKMTEIVTDALGVTGKNDAIADNADKRSDSEKGSVTSKDTDKMAKLAELVQTRTQDLPRQHFPPPKTASQIRSERRRNRTKSMSDGVQLMRQLGGSVANLSLTPASSISDAAANELQHADDDGGPASEPAAAEGGKDTSAAAGRRRSRQRRRLQKSQSENVSMMRAPASSFFGTGSARPLSEEKEEERSDTDMLNTHSGLAARPQHRATTTTRMSTLMEDIPSRSMNASISVIPVGRTRTGFGDDPTDGVGVGVGVGARLSTVLSTESESEFEENNIDIPEPDKDTEKGDRIEPQSNALSDIVSGDEDDGDTVNTGDSDSEHSDFDDVPDVAPSVKEKTNEPEAVPVTWKSRFESFFLSPRYRFMSGVLGTMIVFFIIGMRVEIMLVEGPNDIIPDNESTWHLNAKSAFYFEVSWLSMFILISAWCGTIFAPKCFDGSSELAHKRTDIKMTVAVASDIILCALCLILLLWAEYSRLSCCETQDGKVVCYTFGARLCGGLGTIEPWTGIIALRVLRFRWGKLMTHLILRWNGQLQARRKPPTGVGSIHVTRHAQMDANESRLGESSRSTTSVHAALMHENHMPKSLENETGTIVELWKLAVSIYPDVAAKYGDFSGELLQAMLGIEINEARRRSSVTPGLIPLSKGALDAAPSEPLPGEDEVSRNLAASLAHNESKYSTLDPHARSIILAGKIGKSVRCRKDPEKKGAASVMHHPSAFEVALPSPPKSQNHPRFELDKEKDDDEILDLFINPNARLIRSMRRCERRLPPMLDKWAVVDVVLTNEELVYFDARGVDGLCDNLANMDSAVLSKMNTVKEALFATKGGKGLRLRDVAVGRKVVGHLELEDLDTVKVECLSPFDESGWFVSGDDTKEEDTSSLVDEFWKASNTDSGDAPHQSRNQRWKQVTEHRLKLHSMQGPLYFRFYSDLEDAEQNQSPDDNASAGHVHKNDALLWCQTVARLCGPEQLDQDLAHLGWEGSPELQDFIEPIDRGGDSKGKKQQVFRKVVSTVNMKRSAASKAGSVSDRLSTLGPNTHNPDHTLSGENKPRRKSVVSFFGIDTEKDKAFGDEEASPGLPV